MGPLPLSVSIAPSALLDGHKQCGIRKGGTMGSLGLPKLSSGARISEGKRLFSSSPCV